ncbi:MAG: molybdopterin-dependent oxidoreductase [Deltaproteobacteria bacterium]|nr:molybdopterin-dependent oxidoreductase [Deltaproteobacteria bacterium]
MCYGGCSIRVHRVNGVAIKVEGNPESPIGSGRLCAKGVASLMVLYDPNRVNYPLRRTNPEKGIGVDPGWRRITWEEALEEIAERLRRIRRDDPRKFIFQGTTTCIDGLVMGRVIFLSAFGSPNAWPAGGGIHCGNGAHTLNGILHASWSSVPDFAFCEYALYFGASKGHSAGHAAMSVARQAADARARGMRLVVVDPMCGSAASKADEWVPIRELGLYDAPYLKEKTNAPYLIGPDDLYVRDAETGRPLVWDPVAGRACPYDDPELRDVALEGDVTVNGFKAVPAFQRLREHVRRYPPEEVARITTVPAATVRRLAREFGQAARIGSSIVLDGHVLPYRPVSAIFFRGAQGHRNSFHTCAAISLLNQVVGAADVPGGTLGFNPACAGVSETGQLRFTPHEGPDGLMVTGTWLAPPAPYPPHEVRRPRALGLQELYPLGRSSPLLVCEDREAIWTRMGIDYRPELLMNFGANAVMSVGNAETAVAALKQIPFIVSFDLFLTEFSELADIVLPDTSFLERLDPAPNQPFIFNHPGGPGTWGYPIRQPVVEPSHGRRPFTEVLLELADRVGMRADAHAMLNLHFGLRPPYRLTPEERYTWEEICDRILQQRFGPERGLAWFKAHGVVTWPKQVEEVYWRPFVKARVPVYFEFVRTAAERIQKVVQEMGATWDTSAYQPLPDWLPCASHEVTDPAYDLFAFYYRDVLHTNSFTMQNPWLDEAARLDPNTYQVVINAGHGRRKGLRDGDLVWVESAERQRVKGRVRLSEAIHPEALAIAACAGHWAEGLPVARDKGVFFNALLPLRFDRLDPVSQNLDLCIKVRVYPAEPGEDRPGPSGPHAGATISAEAQEAVWQLLSP